jgi:predicted GNAT family N-acyltransferase
MSATTPTDCTVRRIPASETWPLRHRILRPHQPPEQARYPEDEQQDSYHVGAFVAGTLVGVASLYHEPPPGEQQPGAWRLRGMAVQEEGRGRGWGMALVRNCIEHVSRQKGTLLWCNARTGVSGFYAKAGFEQQGETFMLAGIGPHVVMCHVLAPAKGSVESDASRGENR